MHPSQHEIGRQYRVLKMMIDMHSMRFDRFTRLALAVDLLLLTCSVVFCATAFASDEVLVYLGLRPSTSRVLISAFAVCAFLLSLVSLRTGWKEKAALHKAAREKLTRTLSEFRKARNEEKTWPSEQLPNLHERYWADMESVANIPSRVFVRLKAKYRRKKELSKWLDQSPCCPVWIARVKLFFRDMLRRGDDSSDNAE
jgi:uncharacterized membrane protein YqjE